MFQILKLVCCSLICELFFVNNKTGWVLANILASQLKIKFSTRNKVNKTFQSTNYYFWSKYLFYFNILSWLHSQKSETQDSFVRVTKNSYPSMGETRISTAKERWG